MRALPLRTRQIERDFEFPTSRFNGAGNDAYLFLFMYRIEDLASDLLNRSFKKKEGGGREKRKVHYDTFSAIVNKTGGGKEPNVSNSCQGN